MVFLPDLYCRSNKESSGNGSWLPLPSSVPLTTSLVDYHLEITHRENVHFVAMPHFPDVGFGTVVVGDEGPSTLLLGNSLKIGPQTTNVKHPNIRGGVTLILGGSSQVAGQNH